MAKVRIPLLFSKFHFKNKKLPDDSESFFNWIQYSLYYDKAAFT
jgi:hypothetical protein